MKSISSNRNNAKGFSLIELLLVLGVLAILLVAAFVVYPQVRDRNQANAEVSNLTAIKANTNNLYASRGGNYTGLNTGVAIDARVFPSSMSPNAASSAVASSWGGDVTVASVDATAAQAPAVGSDPAAGRIFTIAYSGVPQGVCLGLVSGAAGNFQGIMVGTTQVITTTGFDPAAAANACDAATPPTVTFYSN